jgi:hypothetical protein
MNVQSEQTGTQKPLVAFEDEITNLCRDDKYGKIAESFATFVASHPGISYLAFEPIPAKISDHLIKKTHAPAAFMTMTIRKPTWTDELRKALKDPKTLETYVTSLEADVQTIAKQTKK